jgi:hypothetical protein
MVVDGNIKCGLIDRPALAESIESETENGDETFDAAATECPITAGARMIETTAPDGGGTIDVAATGSGGATDDAAMGGGTKADVGGCTDAAALANEPEDATLTVRRRISSFCASTSNHLSYFSLVRSK